MFQATESWKCVIVELFQRSEIVLKSKFLLASLIHPSNLIFRKFIFSENMKILSSVCQTSMSFSIPFKTLGPVENTLFSLVNGPWFIHMRWTNERREFSTYEKARWKNATLRELKQPIQTLTQLLNLSRENHTIFLIIARYYVIHMTSHTLQSMSHYFEILFLGRVPG